MPLIVRTLSDQIFEVLRQRIVMHDIPPGAAIRQDVLAGELGTSKIPVREALSRLEGCGMVLSTANRGYVAAPLSPVEADDIFSLRILIEPPTAAATAMNASDAERAEVSDALKAIVAGRGDFPQTLNMRRRMMLSLLIQKDRPTRTAIIIQLFDRAERYHPANPTIDFLDLESLERLVSAWLDRDGATVNTVYLNRLVQRSRLAQEAAAQPGCAGQ
jgi:DNA-binding GntR family transcriptional regulator